MKRAYLTLIEMYNADDIEILYRQNAFEINHYNNKIILKSDEVNDFMSKFAEEVENILK